MRTLMLALLLLAAPAAAQELKCGPHEHLVTERDPDEGAMMKRCVCDEGWDADGPAPPCRERPKGGAKAPAPGKDKKK